MSVMAEIKVKKVKPEVGMKVRRMGILCNVSGVNPDGTVNIRPIVGNWQAKNVDVKELEFPHSDGTFSAMAETEDEPEAKVETVEVKPVVSLANHKPPFAPRPETAKST